MNSNLSRFRFFVAVVVVVSLSLVASQCQATIVGAQSFGNELAGGRITVTYASGNVQAAPIVVGAPDEGTASVLNFFTFSVSGDTFLNEWKLSNDTTGDVIRLVEFDLTGTTATDPNGVIHSPGVLFDDGSSPSTLNGFAGRSGAQYVAGPAILNSLEQAPWLDAMNLGDEFVKEFIEYGNFGPGLTSVWRDDTDIVGTDTGPELPEPSSAALLLLSTACLGLGRRQR